MENPVISNKVRNIVIHLSWQIAIVLVIIGIVIVFANTKMTSNLIDFSMRFFTHFFPPEGGRMEGLLDDERRVVSRLSKDLKAMIVWSSNRSGNHELYLINLTNLSVKRLTNNKYVDYYSKFSPDGKKIVFTRSQRPWVSFREKDSWDIYLIDTNGENERLLVRQGYMPSWTPDGRGIIFLRGNHVIKIDVASRREEILFDGSKEPIRGKFGDIGLGKGGKQLASSIRSVFNGVGIIDLDSLKITPIFSKQSCQIVWSPDYKSLIWVSIGGNGGTQIMRTDVPGINPYIFMDLPGEYSHEYFPRLSNDGNWLIWGAAARGHEHDRADYEIFLWKVNTPWDKAIRLTYYEGNDQWPDIFIIPD